MKEGGEEWIWVDRIRENEEGGRGVYGWTGLKRIVDMGEQE